MELSVISIGSSSSGNSYIITNGRTRIILDVGLSCRKIRDGLSAHGIPESSVMGILVTHEHIDHVKSIRAAAKTFKNAHVFASRGTIENCDAFEHVPNSRLHTIAAQDERQIGDIRVKAFRLSHDAAEPIGYSFRSGDSKLAVITDTGVITDEIFDEMLTSDTIVLEANHEISMLEMGPYPYTVKRRILSDRGHLSNVAAGEALASFLAKRKSLGSGIPAASLAEGTSQGIAIPAIMLAHLSYTNNAPSVAEVTVRSVLEDAGFKQGQDYVLGIAAKDVVSDVFGCKL